MPTIFRDAKSAIETINYAPGLINTADLEAATKTITAVAEASGLANADYGMTGSLVTKTIAIPTDTRLAILQVANRLTFTIDSFDTATILYCRVYVDVQDADHLLIDTSHNGVSQKIISGVTNATTKATIFNLLKDGSAHNFYFYFWVNQANNAVISEVTLQMQVGGGSTGGFGDGPAFSLSHVGKFQFAGGQWSRAGTGTYAVQLYHTSTVADHTYVMAYKSTGAAGALWNEQGGVFTGQSFLSPGVVYIRFMSGTVATDMAGLGDISLLLAA